MVGHYPKRNPSPPQYATKHLRKVSDVKEIKQKDEGKQIGKTTQGEENLKCINIFAEIKKKTTSTNQYGRFKKGYLEMKEFLKKIFKDDSRIRVNKPTVEIK